MKTVNMFDAKSQLSRLVEEVASGSEHEIVIARNGKPAARLVPIGRSANAGKRLGLLAGRFPDLTLAEFNAENARIARLMRGARR